MNLKKIFCSKPVWFRIFEVVVIVILFALFYYAHYVSFDNIFEGKAKMEANLIKSVQNEIIDKSRYALIALSKITEIRNMVNPSCDKMLSNLLKKYIIYANIGVVDTKGELICSGIPYKGIVNFSDRLYFKNVMASKDFAVGDYRVGKVTGQPVLTMGYPIFEDDGITTKGIVSLSLPLTWLDDFEKKLTFPENSSIAIVDETGTILARYPDPQKWSGVSIFGTDLAREMLSSNEGSIITYDLDGITKMMYFSPWGDYGSKDAGRSYVIVGIVAPGTNAYLKQIVLFFLIIFVTAVIVWKKKSYCREAGLLQE